MTDQFEFTEIPPREAGVYVSEFFDCSPFTYDDKITKEKQDRWRWQFRDNDKLEFDTLTSAGFYGPGGRPTFAKTLFEGILGRALKNGDRPSEHYGKIVNVVWGPNKNGRLTIIAVQPYKPGK